MDPARPTAYLALLLVIPASIFAFSRLPPTRAALLILFGGILFLPERVAFDPPLIPPLDKQVIPALCVLVGFYVKARDRMRQSQISGLVKLGFLILLLGPIGTVITNPDTFRYGPSVLPGLTWNDTISMMCAAFLTRILPFYLGVLMFRTMQDAEDLMRAFVIAGIVYTPFILFELRMSPQLHNMVYGFSQHIFSQTVRGDGYRPMCFMAHGLALALLMWSSLFSAWVLNKLRVTLFGFVTLPVAVVESVLFPFLKSFGALIYAIVVVPLALFLKPKTQVRIAVILAIFTAAYPNLRTSQLFPRETLVAMSEAADPERAESLDFRFMNEEILVNKALERPVFGWGVWNRSRVYNEYGDDTTIADGDWIIRLGTDGILGLIAHFMLLLLPIFAASAAIKRLAPRQQSLLAAVCLISIVHTVDLLPNGMYSLITMMLAGAVDGLSRGLLTEKSRGLNPELLARLLARLRSPAVSLAAGRARAAK